MRCTACDSEMKFVLDTPEMNLTGSKLVSVSYSACPDCGLVGKTPLPSEKELRDYYENSWQSEEDRPRECLEHAAAWVGLGLLPYTPLVPLSALDVGSSRKGFLEILRRFLPLVETRWIDAHCKEDPVWIGPGDAEFLRAAFREYSFVACTHVLEHCLAPDRAFHVLANLVSPGGFLYLEVPALEIPNYVCDNIHRTHLWHFSLPSLLSLVRHSELAVVAAETCGMPPGHPTNRLLLRRGMPLTLFSRLYEEQEKNDARARRRLESFAQGDVLYGATDALLRLGTAASGKTVVDLYKAGQPFPGYTIEHPSTALPHAKRAWIATRDSTSLPAIRKYLRENFPHIEALDLFA